MVALSTGERSAVWARAMALAICPPGVLKADFLAAVNAIDDWIELNTASFNLALPQPYRGAASASQKAALLAAVALRKFNGRNI